MVRPGVMVKQNFWSQWAAKRVSDANEIMLGRIGIAVGTQRVVVGYTRVLSKLHRVASQKDLGIFKNSGNIAGQRRRFGLHIFRTTAPVGTRDGAKAGLPSRRRMPNIDINRLASGAVLCLVISRWGCLPQGA